MTTVYNLARVQGPNTESAVNRELAKIAESFKTPGAITGATRFVTTATTVLPTDSLVMADATGAAFAVTLPLASTMLGHRVTIKRLNGGANAVDVECSGAEEIDGSASTSLAAQYDRVTVHAWKNGSTYGWAIIST